MKGLGKDNNGNLRNNIQIFIQYIECVCWISYDRVISCKQKNKMGKKVFQNGKVSVSARKKSFPKFNVKR